MKPLLHPSIDDITPEGILHALSDPVRAAIYSELAASECAATCSTFLEINDRAIPKSTLSQHFRALREAGLVRSERNGVEVRNSTRCAEIAQRFPGLVPTIMKAYGLDAALKKAAAKQKARKARA